MVISSAYDGSGTDELILTGSSVLLENENVLPLRLSGDDEDFDDEDEDFDDEDFDEEEVETEEVEEEDDDEDFNLDEDLSDPAFDDDDDDDEPYYDDEF
jgi:hypothetical protein